MDSRVQLLCLVATLLQLIPVIFAQQGFIIAQVPNPFRVGDKYPLRSEISVCRPIQDHIKRSSARYDSQLVTNTNGDINFSTADSRIMSSRLQSRLNTLAATYKSQFNQRITVLKAWTSFPDPELDGDEFSLHYEGRTVQVRLSNSGYYDDFLLLAVEAGFDWVFYASSNLIRLSVIPTNCERNIDCVFLLDQSGSVGRSNHNIAKRFIENVVSFFSIGPNQSRVGFVSFASSSRISFDLNAHRTLSGLQYAIRHIGYSGGSTATALALNNTRDLLNPANNRGARHSSEGIPKIAVLITDGKSNSYPLTYAAPALKNSGVQVYTIGIGNYDLNELLFISSDPDNEHVFVLKSYRDALGFVDVLSVTTCETQAIVRLCENTTSIISEDVLEYYQAECSSFRSSVFVELIDLQGTSHLYCSAATTNPGPLTQHTIIDETAGTTRRQCVLTLAQGSSVVFIGVQGQEVENSFSLIIMDHVFNVSEAHVTVVEGHTGIVYDISQHLLQTVSGLSFQYEIIEGNEANIFSITSNSGRVQIRNTAVIPFDSGPQYIHLTILARQPSSDCNCARMHLQIVAIPNRMDFEPSSLPNIEVPEDAMLGYDLVTIMALGGVGEIAYSILRGNVDNVFMIDSSSGLIEVSSSLDFERRMNYTLTIRAFSVGTSVSGTIDQTIFVTDTNEPPFFVTPCALSPENMRCSFSVNENEPPSFAVGMIEADDPDLGSLRNGMVIYRFETPTDYFRVDSSGRITTLQMLDHEDTNSHSLVLIVADRCLGCSISIRTTVLITVNDLNDNAPVIFGPVSVEVAENSAAGFVFAQYQATDADSPSNSLIEFSLSYLSGPGPFEIDRYHGILSVSGNIDYEMKQEYTVTVTALNPGIRSNQLSSITTRISVLNLNDNSPMFSNQYSASVNEHSPVSSLVITVEAIDADLGSFGNVSYSILGGNFRNSFNIDPGNGEIRIAEDIDRETIRIFQLMVEASDSGTPQSQRNTTEMLITITDVNDNPPTFNPAMYSAVLREDFINDTNIFNVSAFDNDEPGTRNSDIVYSITEGNVGSVFNINQDTGAVFLEGNLDFENQSFYQLTILAVDRGSPVLNDTAVATISVLNVNESPPVLNGNQTINVSESETVGSSVAVFVAEDPDQMSITFIIRAGNEENKFLIEDSTGTVRLAGLLDYETRRQYTIEIVVSDGMQSTSAYLTVLVLDVNEFTPMFIGNTSFEIKEEEPSGTLVGTVVAVDLDGSSPNSLITYSFAQRSQITQYFNLNADTGNITTNGVLDREELTQIFSPPASSQTVDIVARDHGSPSKQSFVTITITLLDINDNIPMFTDNDYENSLLENLDPNLVVFQVSATDADLGPNGEIRYVFEVDGGSSVSFHIDENRGIVYTTETLDCEQQSSYNFTLYAVDQGTPSLNHSTTGILNIIDENDNSPEFTIDPYIVKVSESVRTGSVIMQVVANDLDKGQNRQVVYSVINSQMMQETGENQLDDFTFLEIDSSTGELRPVTSFNYEREQTVNVTVTATDMGIPRRSGTATAVFVIENVDESPPTFLGPCSVTVPENTTANETITRCEAVDFDNSATSDVVLVTYDIFSGNDDSMFGINNNTGEIFVVSELNREVEASYHLLIRARDLSGKSDFQLVEITVSDVNDNAPQFTAASYSYDFTVARIQNQMQELIKLSATDADVGDNAEVIYSIGNLFQGELSTGIEIVSSDQGMPAMSTSVNLTINFEHECLLQEYSIGERTGIVSAHVLCSIELNPLSLNVVLRTNETFLCNVVYNSKLSYQWIHNGSFITQPTLTGNRVARFSYNIIDASFNDAGEYACKATTSAGSLQTETSTVNIQVRPVITVPPKDQAAKKGENVVFTCMAIGIPEPKIEWYFRDTQKIHEGSRLVVSDVNATKVGTYICVASNAVDDSTANAIASTQLAIYSSENVVELTLSRISNPSENGSCHFIDYDAISSTISDLTFLRTIIPEVKGESICEETSCMPNPCNNGGSCELNDREVGGYICTCGDGFTGKSCKMDVKECDENPCENGGSCVDEIGSFSCLCATGISGYRCQYHDRCRTADLCNQSALCVDTIPSGGYECVPRPNVTSVLIVSGLKNDPGFLDDFLQSYLEKLLASSFNNGRRKRQISTFKTFCEPRFVQYDAIMDLYALLWLCPSGELPPTEEEQSIFCDILLKSGYVQTCKPPGGEEEIAATAKSLPDVTATVGIIFLKRTNSIPLDGLVVKKELVNVGFVNDLMQRTGLEVTGIEVQQSVVNTVGGDSSAGIIVGVILVVLLIAVVALVTALVIVGAYKYKQHVNAQKCKRDRAIQKAFSENDLCSNSQAQSSLDLETTMEVTATLNKYETDGKTDLESNNGIPSKLNGDSEDVDGTIENINYAVVSKL